MYAYQVKRLPRINISMAENFTPIQELGEFGLINSIQQSVKQFLPSTIKGIGDDCAVIEKNEEEFWVVSTDTMCEAVHFDLRYVPLKHLGYKALSTAISDIAAMNGIPSQVLVSLALSSRFTKEAVDELYEGMNHACENYKVDLVGGDTTSSQSGLMISVTVIGSVKKEKIAYRSTAKKGDLVCVTGDFGAAYLGLHLLEREKQAFLENDKMQPKLGTHSYLLQRQLKPEARTDAIFELEDLGIVPTSMIDVSDGLASEIMHLATQSNLGAQLYEEKIPIANETFNAGVDIFKIDPITCALNGGEDYELLMTIKQEDFDKIEKHPEISIIGFMTDPDQGVNLITKQGNVKEIQAQGWQHFKKPEKE